MSGRWFARKTDVPGWGIVAASGVEAAVLRDLWLRQQAGEIRDLEAHPRFRFVVNGVYVGAYRADARYVEVATGTPVVVDAKSKSGYRARGYGMAKKLMRALYGIEIVEVAA